MGNLIIALRPFAGITRAIARKSRSVGSHRFEHDVLRAVIQHVTPHLGESFRPLDDLEKMIAGELTDFACEERRAIGEQQLFR
jgi:hypothetical protein